MQREVVGSLKGLFGLDSLRFQQDLDGSFKNVCFSKDQNKLEVNMENIQESFDKITLEHERAWEDTGSNEKNLLDSSCRFDFGHKDMFIQGYYDDLRFSSIRNVNESNLKNFYNTSCSQYSDPNFFGMINGECIYKKVYDEHSILSMFVLYILEHNMCTYEELLRKEEFRLFLSGILHNCRPSAKLVLFGSVASGLATVNSDMDFCVIDDSLDMHTHEFPKILAEEIKKYDMEVMLLFRTRVSIIKVNSKGSSMFPEGIACDIGFNNKLAIYNTNLLTTYSKCDHRVRKIILFIKYWAKRRKINDPYHGTLSSYGYVLLVLHYLMNIISIPLLPNLQRMKATPGKLLVQSEIECDGFNVWFFKDIDTSRPFSSNMDSLGKLVYGFFYYYAYQFNWRDHVVSIRSQTGLLTKKDKGWTQAVERVSASDNVFKDRYVLAIEDPFEITHNVGRTVNRQSAHMIRGEFFRASKLSGSRVKSKICDELCEERIVSDNFSKTF
ncbi:uncharacterized protein T551_01917 [Pneumocystis jirovecii RU7]|uniref:polynucleotide adenylyltransferase n=1 Tax=Pneumocystis jirovecii (strain RU7) TaxID=1408657 RepID=A0A0W4ZNL9_PNEJ7|nr:uncharacterized protein T551_01917 [Pneumocystis jirovecii RU7]KTW29973.1 hypothetical protein T551_01917 [Pneumocystis jirovecii RU7]